MLCGLRWMRRGQEFGSESDSASASEFVPDQGTTATSSTDTDVPVRRARTRASERGKKRAGRDARYGVVLRALKDSLQHVPVQTRKKYAKGLVQNCFDSL